MARNDKNLSERDIQLLQRQQQYFQGSLNSYKLSLMAPHKHFSKIPTLLPTETTLANLKYNFNLTPNATGKFVIVIDPFQRDMVYNVSATLDGLGTVGSYTTFAQTIDTNIIDQWRLVSMSVQVQYIGRLDSLSGFFCGAITSNVSNATNDTFVTFQNIEDIQNKLVVNPMDGLNLLYVPSDTTMTDFTSTTIYTGATHSSKWKNLFVIYGDGLPNTSCVRVDIFKNFEYISKPSYREYIPHYKSQPDQIDSSINQIGSIQKLTNKLHD